MPVFKNKVSLKLGRHTSLLIEVEAGLTGLGNVTNGLRSRLGSGAFPANLLARLQPGKQVAPAPAVHNRACLYSSSRGSASPAPRG
jgi:hypothetical protein